MVLTGDKISVRRSPWINATLNLLILKIISTDTTSRKYTLDCSYPHSTPLTSHYLLRRLDFVYSLGEDLPSLCSGRGKFLEQSNTRSRTGSTGYRSSCRRGNGWEITWREWYIRTDRYDHMGSSRRYGRGSDYSSPSIYARVPLFTWPSPLPTKSQR